MKTPYLQSEFEPLHYWPPVFLQPADPLPIIAPMTVGIGAICDGGKAVVMAADRLVSVGEAGLYLEMDRKKLTQLTPRVWMAITGTIQDSEYARDRFTQASHLFAGQSVHQIAKRLRRAIEHIRARQIEERIIRPYLGISYAQYSSACVQGPASPGMSDVYNKINTFVFDLELLIAGIDDSGAHLYRVTSFWVNSHEGLAFTAIGCGRPIATSVLARYGQSTLLRPIAETVYRVYEAKRASEQTQLVGATTDILLFRNECEPEFLSEELIGVLAETFDKRKQAELSSEESAAVERMLPQPTQPPAQSTAADSKRNRRGR